MVKNTCWNVKRHLKNNVSISISWSIRDIEKQKPLIEQQNLYKSAGKKNFNFCNTEASILAFPFVGNFFVFLGYCKKNIFSIKEFVSHPKKSFFATGNLLLSFLLCRFFSFLQKYLPAALAWPFSVFPQNIFELLITATKTTNNVRPLSKPFSICPFFSTHCFVGLFELLVTSTCDKNAQFNKTTLEMWV